MSMLQYGTYRMQVRDKDANKVSALHDAHKLWMAFIVTLSARMEQERIAYQANNQDMFRLESTSSEYPFLSTFILDFIS
jgi:hypothetical protein